MMEGEAVNKQDGKARLTDPSLEENLRDIQEKRERATRGKKVIKGKDIPWRQGRQGFIRRYANGRHIPGLALDTMRIFVQEIRTHSGRHVHQGGLGIFVLKGKGYTVVDGVKHTWEPGDLIMLPIKQGGVEHQHFNLDNKPSRWIALRNTALEEFTGKIMEQREDHPDWEKLAQD